MTYEERLDLLVDSITRAKLNDEEITMIYGVLGLSDERNNFIKKYNAKIKEIFNPKESVVNE